MICSQCVCVCQPNLDGLQMARPCVTSPAVCLLGKARSHLEAKGPALPAREELGFFLPGCCRMANVCGLGASEQTGLLSAEEVVKRGTH